MGHGEPVLLLTRPTTRRGLRLYALLALALAFAALVGLGVDAVLRYQALVDDSRADFTLSPDQRDVVYCVLDGEPQKLDLYFPERAVSDPAPALIYVHGGSFTGGDKAKGNGAADIPAMVERGYLVASVNYRLAPEHRFPAPIEDVKCAIRYLRANAQTYGLDADRLGIWGTSAGGHLSLLVGLTDGSAGFDQGEYLEQSSEVAVVADLFGPTDLTAADLNLLQRFLLGRAFGTTDPGDPLLVRASPISYVRGDAPPILILHGENDDAVPASQSRRLHERLQSVGATSRLVMVKNANHEFAPTGGPISPTRQEITEILGGFFDEHVNR